MVLKTKNGGHFTRVSEGVILRGEIRRVTAAIWRTFAELKNPKRALSIEGKLNTARKQEPRPRSCNELGPPVFRKNCFGNFRHQKEF